MGKQPKKPNIDSEIDANLRRVYQELLNEDVPDRFKDLLARLRAQEDDGEGSKT